MVRLIRGGQCRGDTREIEVCKKILEYSKNTKKGRCKIHPHHDPYNKAEARKVYIPEDCIVCRGIHYGVQAAGSYEGESVANPKEKTATTILPLLNLVQFGLVRHRLHFNHYYGQGPTWSVDMNSQTVFLNVLLTESTAQMFEKWGCKIISQTDEVIFTLAN